MIRDNKSLLIVAAATILITACGDDSSACYVTQRADGGAVIRCDDGSEVTVPAGKDGAPGAAGTSCSVRQEGAVATITCPDGSRAQVGRHEAVFTPLSFPQTEAELRQVRASASLSLDGKPAEAAYRALLRSGDEPGGAGSGKFGLIVDQAGQPVLAQDGSQFVSNDNDFSSLIPVGDRLFSVSHFESRPGAMYLTELRQDKDNGQLTAISTQPIDFSSQDGLWVPCAGSVTPWGTHLGGEEYPPDARAIFAQHSTDSLSKIGSYTLPMLRYYGVDIYTDTNSDGEIDATMADGLAKFNPYFVGYPTEVKLTVEGGNPKATPVKHYSMGRVAIELSYVMPDRKTVYISDDGTNVGFFMYIADTAGDLSRGRLYAMKWKQTQATGGGAADIEWIALDAASISDQEVSAKVHSGIGFADLFEVEPPAADGSCPTAGFVPISVTSLSYSGDNECLKVKPGMEALASRLETTRYAAYKGATVELRKEEGITFDPHTGRLFVAMSSVEKGMEDGASQDKGGPNHIRLPKNKCGTVFSLPVGKDAKIGSDYVAQRWEALVSGVPVSGDPKNTCHRDGIANPDNLTYVTGTHTLIIGEDTGSGHQNDAVWAYNRRDGQLTRIATTPYGSETTSPYWYPNINGWAYLQLVVQHPYGESDQSMLTDPAQARAYTGYLGPFPALPTP